MYANVSFENFQTVATVGFWNAIIRHKLDNLRLDETPFPVLGFCDLGTPGIRSRMLLTEQSLNIGVKNSVQSTLSTTMNGVVMLKNTLESYNNFDKKKFMNEVLNEMKNNLKENNQSEIDFFMLLHADMKTFKVFYHVFYPALFNPVIKFHCFIEKKCEDTIKKIRMNYSLGLNLKDEDCIIFADTCGIKPFTDSNVVILGWSARNILFRKLALMPGSNQKFLILRQSIADSFHCVIKSSFSSTEKNDTVILITGWETNEEGKVSGCQQDLSRLMDSKKIAYEASMLNLKLMKWRILPSLNLDRFVDQKVLIIGAGTLGCNVSRCLLGWGFRRLTFVDSGHISPSNPTRQSLYNFSDVSKTHFNKIAGNNSTDTISGEKKKKALVAAARIMEIDPNVEASGVVLVIPSPGHLFDDLEDTQKSIEILMKAVKEADVVFNLTDSRESRWLPTVLGATYGKIVITIALGFDSYLAMRHGISKIHWHKKLSLNTVNIEDTSFSKCENNDAATSVHSSSSQQNPDFIENNILKNTKAITNTSADNKEAAESYKSTDFLTKKIESLDILTKPTTVESRSTELIQIQTEKKLYDDLGIEKVGCYFCQDAVAPNDTTKNRTIDQQCTVTRPGLSMIAAGVGVELLASLLQHPLEALAPVTSSSSPLDKLDSQRSSILGVVPHQIRGFVSHQQNIQLSGAAYEHCTACSDSIINSVQKDGVDFILKALLNPTLLEVGLPEPSKSTMVVETPDQVKYFEII